jgi:hypothetical protein
MTFPFRASILWWLAAIAPAFAQLSPDDLVVADLGTSPGVYVVSPTTGALVATLLRTGPDFPNAIVERSGAARATGHPGYLVGMVGVPNRLLSLETSGAVTTLLALPHHRMNGLWPDADGTWLLTATDSDGLFRFDPGRLALTTLANHPNSVTLNLDTGHYGVALFGRLGPSVLEFDPQQSWVTTLKHSIPEISSMAWDPSTSTYTITDYVNFDPAEFVRLDPTSRTITSLLSPASMHYLNAHVSTVRGTWWLAGGRLTGGSGVHEVSDQGVVLRSLPLSWPDAAPAALAMHGSRPLATSGHAAPATTFSFHLASPLSSDRGRPYLLAVSLASHPGITLTDGRRIDLAFDALALQSVLGNLGPFFGGGTNLGTLDSQGRATARLTLPATFPAGTGFRIFAAFVVVDFTAPSGWGTVSNTVGFSLE